MSADVADVSHTSSGVDLAARRPTSPTPSVSVQRCRSGPWTIFVVDGEMDSEVIPLLPELSASEARCVVFDLCGVSFMDAAALGLIASIQQKARQAGGCVRLVAPSARVCRIMMLTGTDQAFLSFPTLDAALTAPVLGAPNLAC